MTQSSHFVNQTLAERRREAVQRLGVLERLGDPALTALARVATVVTGAEAAAVHILDDDYQHRVAAVNAPLDKHPIADAMCSVVVDRGAPVVSSDAAADERFAFSSFVGAVRFYASVPLVLSDGTVVGTLCAFDGRPRDIDGPQRGALIDLAAQAVNHVELTRIALDLNDAASRDPVTGVLNRLAFADRIDHALSRVPRHDTSVLLVLADVDEFKGVNDTFGHSQGDAVLTTIAGRLSEAARAEDSVARLGGDEFGVLAELNSSAAAPALVARLRAALTVPPVLASDGHTVAVTVGAVQAAPGESAPALIERADAELYRQKGLR